MKRVQFDVIVMVLAALATVAGPIGTGARAEDAPAILDEPGQEVIYAFPLDSDPGWSTMGEWAFGTPSGHGGIDHGNPDPSAGATGSHVYGVNLAGDYQAAVAGPKYLTAGPLDFRGFESILLSFQRWLNTDSQPYVRATVEASSDAVHWTTIWANPTTAITDSTWTAVTYDLSAVADDRATVYVRWGHEIASQGALRYSGWNIDDVQFLGRVKDTLTVAPLDGLVSSGPQGGPFTPAGKTYTLINTGQAALEWSAAADANWLEATPSEGTLTAGASIMVEVSLNAAAGQLGQGAHNAQVEFTDITSGLSRTRPVTLQITPPAPARAFHWFPLDTDPGWETQGDWAFGVPQGRTSSWSSCRDPSSGHTGSKVYGYNLAGDYTDYLAETYLTTGRLNCWYHRNVSLRFWRWLGVEDSYWDHAAIEVSNDDGATWQPVWAHGGATICDGQWAAVEYDLSQIADGQSAVRIRWVMGPTDSTVTYPGWNIDDVALLGDRIDDLLVTPDQGFTAVGVEGGPFSPRCHSFTLRNVGSQTLGWTLDWLGATSSGSLAPDATTTVNVCLDRSFRYLPRGTYVEPATFCNTTSGVCQIREVTVIVDPFPVQVAVTDTIEPADDLDMPFGDVFVGVSRTEQVVVTNTSGLHDLVISDISFGGKYFEDFEAGVAQGWSEDVDADWSVVSGEYRAASAASTWMMSRYVDEEWEDLSAQVVIRRSGSSSVSQAIVLRATADFDESIGSAYIFQIATNGAYGVWKQVNGSWSWLQSWTASSAIQTGTNTLLATAEGASLSFCINGTLVWSGSDGDLTAGRIGLGGYTDPSAACTHYFDDVQVGEPGSIGPTLSPEQQWYNAQAQTSSTTGLAPMAMNVSPYAGEPAESDAPRTGDVAPLSGEFRLGLPPGGPPWIVPPGQSMTFDVTLEPTAYREYESAVVIACNDTETPEIEVLLSGAGLRDYLEIAPDEIFEISGHPGGPFSPSAKSYTLSNTGPAPIGWAVEKNAPWLDLSASAGVIGPGGETPVIVTLNAQVQSLDEGVYTDTLIFTNTTSGVVQTRGATLTVARLPKMWVAPEAIAVTVPEGGSTTATMTIGNTGDAELVVHIRTHETSRQVVPQGKGTELGTKGDTIVIEYEFGQPQAEKLDGYTLLTVDGLEQYERTGAPIVPVQPARVLVPYGKQVTAVRVVPVETVQPADKVLLPPAQKPYPLSQPGTVQPTAPDPAIYNQAGPWPGTRHEVVGVQSTRGYQLLTVNLFPVQYTPTTGSVSCCTKLRLEVDLADAGKNDGSVLRPSAQARDRLASAVDNPSALGSYPEAPLMEKGSSGPLGGLASGPAEYVIITTPQLEAAPGPWNLQALRDHKMDWGIQATIVTTDWIYAHYDGTRPSGGQDNQTRIRNFLIDAYQLWGTRYALLAGGNALIPARMFYVGGDTMPVDNYYGCVDPPACTFDNNANGVYGETHDGVSGGDVDLLAEIHVGRACVANATEVGNFVRKTLEYDTTQSEYLPMISMLGEYLGFGGISDYATESMEQIRLGSCADSYCTTGFANHTQPDFYDFDLTRNLYDSPQGSWPKSALLALMNADTHVFNHLGHANETYCMKLDTSDLGGLTNTNYFFVYSQGCLPGAFDTPGCFAERITEMEHGAVAVIMNARYGWGRLNSTDGPSQRFARQFWDAALGEAIVEMGPANQDSKEDNLWGIGDEIIRWCYYELNLFGDPQQPLRFVEACEWLDLDPEHGTVAAGGGTMPVLLTFKTINDEGQVLQPGTYTGSVIVGSNDPTNPSAAVQVSMTIVPDNMSVAPTEDLQISGPEGGSFNPSYREYTIANTGDAPLAWTAQWSEPWCVVWPMGGTLPAGESVEMYVSLTQAADRLEAGAHSDTVTITNTTSGNIRTRRVMLLVGQSHYFTELFDADDNDLAHQTLTFTPEGPQSFYGICRDPATAFATDPAGGTPLDLEDDDYVEVTLTGGAHVPFYGTSYASFFVGSNGYITFSSGDVDRTESLAEHFALPRISALFDDLSPQAGGTVWFKQLGDRAVVTFEDVPEYFAASPGNSFQIELFFDGRIRVTWLDLAAKDGLAGLSAGGGVPSGFVEDDLTVYVPCWTPCDYDHDGDVDQSDFGHFQLCLSGSGSLQPDPACLDARLDEDIDVDYNDRAIFLRCMSGPGVTADPNCGD